MILLMSCMMALQGNIEEIPTSFCPETGTYHPIHMGQEQQIPFQEIILSEEAPKNYRINIGDTFRISIYGEDQTTKDVVVSPSGELTYLFPDPVPAVGKTIAELRENLEEQLKKHFLHPYLSMTPTLFASQFYTINGEVNEPGSKLIEGNPTLLSALCEARGFTMNTFQDHYVDFSDLDYSFIARNGEYLPVNFRRLLEEGDLTQDVLLKAGDYIYIQHRALHRIYVLGEVITQQSYQYLTKVTLAEVLAESGGVTLFASSRAVVIRNSLACPVHYLIDINLLLKGCAPDFPLQPGDIVYVPARNFSFLREVFRSAMRNFVGIVSSQAGNTAYIHVQPDAAGISGPVNVISFGAGVPIGAGTTVVEGEATN